MKEVRINNQKMTSTNMKKVVKESLNEKIDIDSNAVKEKFDSVIKYLRTNVYPKLSDNELYVLNLKLKDWFNHNVY